ncbi:MAG: HAD-IA family hydrolase [Candidatus Nanoarchaeia archaeon]|nr:HAD-IA family hydrolase [Candidatus Nanoarchaeia archaeon]
MNFKTDTVLFDLDGTLINYTKGWKRFWNPVVYKACKPFVETLPDYSEETNFSEIIKYTEEKLKEKNLFWESFNNECYEAVKKGLEAGDEITPYQEAVDVLENLSKNYKMGLITNHNHSGRDAILQAHDLDRFFDFKISPTESESLKFKPSPDMIHFAMKKMNAKKAVYVGDSHVDVEASISAGIPCIIVERGNYSINHTLKVKTLNELIGLLADGKV